MEPAEKPGACSIPSRTALNLDITRETTMSQLPQETMTQLTQSATIKLSIGDKEKTLRRLQDDMWLGEDSNGNITIGVRPASPLACFVCRCVFIPPSG